VSEIQYNNDNKGVMFKNNKEEGEEQRPDLRGSLTVICYHCHKKNELDTSAWFKKARKTGNDYLFQLVEKKDAWKEKMAPPPPPPPPPALDDWADAPPF
jgi:hypothetical protein